VGAPSDVSSEALSAACALVRKYPKLAHGLLHEQPEAGTMLAAFARSKVVVRYLRAVPVRRQRDELDALVHRADEYVHGGGQAARVAALYAQQRDSGQLEALLPTRRAVHRAAFSLAYEQTPTLACLRLIGALMAEQSGIEVTAPAVKKHLEKLQRDGLLTYVPGKRGNHRAESGTIVLDDLPAGVDDLGHEVGHLLTLTSNERLAVEEYKQAARKATERRAAAANALHRSTRDARAAEVRLNAQLDAIAQTVELDHVLDGIHL
jgi:hypothetical protein